MGSVGLLIILLVLALWAMRGVELVGVKLALDLRTMGGERLALRTVLRLRDVRGL